MIRYLFMLLPIAIIILVDVYAYQAFKAATTNKWVHYLYIAISLGIYAVFITALFTDPRTWSGATRSYLTSIFLLVFISKLLISVFLLFDDTLRIGRWIVSLFQTPAIPTDGTTTAANYITRSQFISRIGILGAALPFATLLYGMVRNAYNYQIKKVALPIANLPDVFEGLTIVQISDIHSGSFTQQHPVALGVDMINGLNPDLVFFTGDLVNNRADEAEDYIDIFGKIKAKLGVFSITGNHDYGEYVPWETKADEHANFERLKDNHKRMGWRLLMNENHIIERNGHKLAILGVENWSALLRFPKYGKLHQAYEGTQDSAVKLLLSHDPSHWRAEILPKYPDINAVFSGHTHGFQLGINWNGFKWSPAQWMYKEWMGLYEDAGRHLYVNPGYGFLGYPGRVGILPEITHFTLTKA